MAEVSSSTASARAGSFSGRITVASPALHRRQLFHFWVVTGGAAALAATAVAWSIIAGLHWIDLGLAVAAYFLTMIGVEIGFHRCLTHNSFKAHPWLRGGLAILGAMAGEGPAAYWVANHRRHHSFSDRDGDPHSPRRGFWTSHLLWMLEPEVTFAPRFASDILGDPALRFVDRHYFKWLGLGLFFPGLVEFAVVGTVNAAISGCLWGGGVRLFVAQHGSYFINSGCHMFGARPFDNKDLSTNFTPMIIPSLGQSLHNNHHAFPNSATTALLKGQFDPGERIIKIFGLLGWAGDIVLPTFEALEAKLGSDASPAHLRRWKPRHPKIP